MKLIDEEINLIEKSQFFAKQRPISELKQMIDESFEAEPRTA